MPPPVRFAQKILAGAALILALSGVFAPAVALAGDYVPLAPLPGTGASGCDPTNYQSAGCKANPTLSSYLAGGYRLAIAGAGILAVLMIVVGGFNYISTDSISGKETGKETIKGALGGLLLAFGSYIILQMINPNLVSLNLSFGPPLNPSDFNVFTNFVAKSNAELGSYLAEANKNISAIKDAATRAAVSDQLANQLENNFGYKDLVKRKQDGGVLTSEEETLLQYFQNQIDQARGAAADARQHDGGLTDIQRIFTDFSGTVKNKTVNDYESTISQIWSSVSKNTAALSSRGKDDLAGDLRAKANDLIEQLCNQLYGVQRSDSIPLYAIVNGKLNRAAVLNNSLDSVAGNKEYDRLLSIDYRNQCLNTQTIVNP
jgi:hypothetical protein